MQIRRICLALFLINNVGKMSTFVQYSPHKLPRLHIQDTLTLSKSITVTSNIAHYLGEVMRSPKYVRAFNEVDGEYICEVHNNKSRKRDCSLLPVEIYRLPLEKSKLSYSLYTSPIKSKRMKSVVEKATELGVEYIVPVISQNTNVVRKEYDDIETLQKIATQSAEQSERMSVPKITVPVSLAYLLDHWGHCSDHNYSGVLRGKLFVCRERSDEATTPILAALDRFVAEPNGTQSCSFLVGPEGGYTSEEFDMMSQARLQSCVEFVTLGKSVLRSDTASICAILAASLCFQDLYSRKVS